MTDIADGTLCTVCNIAVDHVTNPGRNTGSVHSPNIKHCRCAAAVRRLIDNCADDEERKELQQLRRTDPRLFHLKVMELEHSHVAKFARQGSLCRTIVERMLVQARLVKQQGVTMFDEPGFKAYQKYQRNKTDAEADILWDQQVGNADNFRVEMDGTFFIATKNYQQILFEQMRGQEISFL